MKCGKVLSGVSPSARRSMQATMPGWSPQLDVASGRGSGSPTWVTAIAVGPVRCVSRHHEADARRADPHGHPCPSLLTSGRHGTPSRLEQATTRSARVPFRSSHARDRLRKRNDVGRRPRGSPAKSTVHASHGRTVVQSGCERFGATGKRPFTVTSSLQRRGVHTGGAGATRSGSRPATRSVAFSSANLGR